MSHNPNLPIMPKATAVWLIENTSLTFKQIAVFCGMHELEVKGIADGEVAQGIIGVDPISHNQLDSEELQRCMKTEGATLKLSSRAHLGIDIGKSKKAKYTPVARRQDKPDAIYWLTKNYPDIPDSRIVKLIGTTKSTIAAIRDRSHWNIKNIRLRDPVLLGLCSQTELDNIVEKMKLSSPATILGQGNSE